jgi:hypothetical protein
VVGGAVVGAAVGGEAVVEVTVGAGVVIGGTAVATTDETPGIPASVSVVPAPRLELHAAPRIWTVSRSAILPRGAITPERTVRS